MSGRRRRRAETTVGNAEIDMFLRLKRKSTDQTRPSGEQMLQLVDMGGRPLRLERHGFANTARRQGANYTALTVSIQPSKFCCWLCRMCRSRNLFCVGHRVLLWIPTDLDIPDASELFLTYRRPDYSTATTKLGSFRLSTSPPILSTHPGSIDHSATVVEILHGSDTCP